MSSIALPTHSSFETTTIHESARSGLLCLIIGTMIGGMFYMTEHGWNTSKSEAFTQTAEEMQATAAGGNTIRRFAFLGLAALGTIGLFYGRDRACRITSFAIPMLGLYFFWCLSSVLWADSIGFTLRRVIVLAFYVLGAAGLARTLSGREILKIAVVVPLCYLAIGILAELSLGSFRPWAGEYRFSGTLHPNTQGLTLASMCFAAAALAFDAKASWKYWLPAGIGLFFILMTKSRTSAAGVIVAIFLLWTLSTSLRLKFGAAFLGGWVASGALLFALLVGVDVEGKASEMALMGRQEQAESLTGRLPIWTEVSRYLVQRPWMGYGYDSFWTAEHIDAVSEELHWGIREAHSSYVDTVLSTGYIGLFLLMCGLLAMLWKSASVYIREKLPLAGWVFALLIFALINACTESAMTMPLYVPFMLICAMLQIGLFPEVSSQPCNVQQQTT
ncbi:O-antigen ligase family protein [Calycomorphotria hydatis]|uniref:O-Antigen ligase n=1 Tax=Calycomorphotria hydatis TaxID=2528027 RepID=A0A517TCR5_9PLAN|nr:O-antigen ligase family protein [Calycomorphotria hydatis]QDT66170.1 O-Antigen ligase [Calycomorphotria hydatis]